MSDGPRLPPKVPQIPPRGDRVQRRPMAERPGREAQQPYIDNNASIGSLAKHMRIGIDQSKPMTTVDTRQLMLILDTLITFAFGGQLAQQFQADLSAAMASAMSAQQARAETGGVEE